MIRRRKEPCPPEGRVVVPIKVVGGGYEPIN
jgi:hypothetical protein